MPWKCSCAVCRAAGDEDRPKRTATCRDTWMRKEAGQTFTGWSALAEHVGEAVVAGARALLQSPSEREARERFRERFQAAGVSTNGAASDEQAARRADSSIGLSSRLEPRDTSPAGLSHQFRKRYGQWPPRDWTKSTEGRFAGDDRWVTAVERRENPPADESHAPDVNPDGRPTIDISHDIEGMTNSASEALRGDPPYLRRIARSFTSHASPPKRLVRPRSWRPSTAHDTNWSRGRRAFMSFRQPH